MEKAFFSHILKYVGVAQISGSIVHFGTLGGNITKYLILIAIGVISFIVGTILEKNKQAVTAAYIATSVLLSVAIGMVGGGSQHFTDGAVYASFLIPIGILFGYIIFVIREDKASLTKSKVCIAIICSLSVFGALYGIAHAVPSLSDHHTEQGHH